MMSSCVSTSTVPKTNAKPIPSWFELSATPVAIVLSFSGNQLALSSAGVHW